MPHGNATVCKTCKSLYHLASYAILIEALPGPFLEISSKVMKETAMDVNGRDVKVLAAELGDDAVIKGTAKLASELIEI